MRASIAASLAHLELPDVFRRTKVLGFNLEKTGLQVNTLYNSNLERNIGSIEFKSFIDSPCLYINKEFKESTNRLHDLTDMLVFARGIIHKLTFSTWLVKDNSVNTNAVISMAEDNYVAVNRGNVVLLECRRKKP